jgi:hypothetical protein
MTSKPKRVARQHIPTWVERCDIHEGIVSNSMIQARMQDEIDDLRLALEVAKQTIVCISRCLADNHLKEKE